MSQRPAPNSARQPRTVAESGEETPAPHSEWHFLQPSENLPEEKPVLPRCRLSWQRGCSAAPNPGRPHPAQLGMYRSSRSADTPELFSLTLAPEFPVSQRAQTQPGPSRPSSRPFPALPGPARAVPVRGGPLRSLGFSSVGLPTNAASGWALSSHRPCPCLVPAAPVGNEALSAAGISVVSAQPAHLNVLLVPSWHSLPPDRSLQSKHFGAQQLSSLSCRCGNHRALCLEGCCGFSP